MNREEIKNTIRMLSAIYPKQFDTKQAIIDTIDAWTFVFSNDSAEVINSAVMVYINQPHEFAPTPGQLREIIYKETHKGELSEIEAWNLVAKAIRNGTYGAEAEFDKLPKTVQQAIGDASYLRNLASTEDLNTSVESSNFFKRYRAILDRQKTDETVNLLTSAGVKQIGEQG